jgi:uncharacterized protein
MSHTPHDLHDVFPDAGALLHRLKLEDAHFTRLAAQYDKLNHEVHLIDSGVTPASDDHVEMLKRQRLALLDEIATLLAKAAA